MSYIDNNLMTGETVVYRANLHWAVFLWPIVLFVFSLFLFSGGSDVAPIGTLFLIVALISAILAFLNFKTSEFGVTNKRVIVKVGFIRRNSLEVLLNKVEGISVNQGIIGRILGFGSITVSGIGGSKDPFHKIANPLELRKKVQEEIEKQEK